jgi:aspartyl-tRNA(Asn)/glutamyl-tRNA(Gln) amidotransferase subunit A
MRIGSILSASISSNSGMPSIAFVIGYLQNMPIGIELVAKQYSEPTLIEMAFAYEKHSAHRQIPVMPLPNKQMTSKSIAEINNDITLLGQQAYDQVLKKNDSNKLTPKLFQQIAHSILR